MMGENLLGYRELALLKQPGIMPRTCPSCSAPMQPEIVHGVTLDICPDCAGIWFDADELRALLAKDVLALTEIEERNTAHITQGAQGPSHLLCPDCDVVLEEYHYLYNSPIILHTCSRCGGFWVADGELAKMQTWLRQAHQPSTGEARSAELIAQATIAHENEMYRQRNLQSFCGVLGRRVPGWFGFLP